MYATPILFSRTASEWSASAAAALGRIENAECDFFAASTAVSGSTIPSDTAIIAANQNVERMRIRIGTKFSSLGHAPTVYCAASPTNSRGLRHGRQRPAFAADAGRPLTPTLSTLSLEWKR